MNTYDIIDRLPFEFAARLRSDPFLLDVPVVVAEEGNINLEMARRQAITEEKHGKRGAAIIVLQLVADDLNPGLQLGPMKFYPASLYASADAAADAHRILRAALKGIRIHLRVTQGATINYYPNAILESSGAEPHGLSVDHAMTFVSDDVTSTAP